jgi:nitroimidazol reductase NimA-like FMN-containing flavoprotein (pyridoxamine 5'-phosphate oxidase superfamily)
MRETATDLERLQALLDDSIEQAIPFLRSSYQMPERSLSAEQLVAHLEGSLTVALATVTARGEPRVAPINAFFLRASFYVPSVAQAARARHLASRPAASLTYYEGTSLAVIAHGRVDIVDAEQEEFAKLDALQVQIGNQSVTEWHGDGVYIHLQPNVLYTYSSAL